MNPHDFYSCYVFPTALRTTFQALAHTWFGQTTSALNYRMCSQWQINPIYSSFFILHFYLQQMLLPIQVVSPIMKRFKASEAHTGSDKQCHCGMGYRPSSSSKSRRLKRMDVANFTGLKIYRTPDIPGFSMNHRNNSVCPIKMGKTHEKPYHRFPPVWIAGRFGGYTPFSNTATLEMSSKFSPKPTLGQEYFSWFALDRLCLPYGWKLSTSPTNWPRSIKNTQIPWLAELWPTVMSWYSQIQPGSCDDSSIQNIQSQSSGAFSHLFPAQLWRPPFCVHHDDQRCRWQISCWSMPPAAQMKRPMISAWGRGSLNRPPGRADQGMHWELFEELPSSNYVGYPSNIFKKLHIPREFC